MHWGTYTGGDSEAAFPFHETVLSMQLWNLYEIMGPETVKRIMNAELVALDGEEVLTLPEVFDEVTTAIFSELEEQPRAGSYSNTDPMIRGTR